MRVICARQGDIADCFVTGNRDACERVIWGYYICPRLQKMLEALEQGPVPWPPPPGFDDSQGLLQELVPVLLAPLLAGPNPQPALPPELRLHAFIKFRDGLQKFTAELDMEIEQLQGTAQRLTQ